MEKLGKWIAKYRWPIIILFLIVTAYMGYQALKIQVIDNITNYVPSNDPQISFFKAVAKEFGMNNFILVGMEYDDLFSKSSLTNVEELTKGLEKLPNVVSVLSMTNAPWIESANGTVQISKIENIIPTNTEKSVALKKQVMASPLFKGQFVSPNGRSTLMIVSLSSSMTVTESVETTKKIENYINANSTAEKIYYSGIPPTNLSVKSIAIKNLMILIPLSLFAVALVLFLAFRNVQGFLLPLISVIISTIWTIGMIHLLGLTMTLASISVPIIVIALGNAYGIYIVNKYFEEKDKDHSVRLSHTLHDIGIAVILSAMTVVASFLSLLTVNINPIKYFGIFTAVGIFFALVVNVFFITALVSFSNKHVLETKGKDSSAFLKKGVESILSHRRASIAFAIVIIGIFGVFATMVRSNMSIWLMLGKKNDVVKSMDYFNDNFKGSDFVIVNFKGDATDPYLLRAENLVSLYAENHFPTVVGGSYSLEKVMREMNNKFNGQNFISGSSTKIQNLWFLTQGSNLSQLVNSGATDTIVQIRVNPNFLGEIEKLRKGLDSFVTSNIYKRYSYVKLDNASPEDIQRAIAGMDLYVNAYLTAKNLKVDPKSISKVVSKVLTIPNEQLLKADPSMAASDLTNYLNSFGMLAGLPATTIFAVKSSMIKTFSEGYTPNTLEKDLLNSVGSENEQSLATIIEMQITNVAETLRENYAKSLLSSLGFLNTDEINFLSLTLSSRTVPVPSQNGKHSFKVGITGIPIVYIHVSNMLTTAQYYSMIISAIIVFMLLVFQMNSWWMGAIGLIPVILTVIFNFGVMGAFKIPINEMTVTIASITIGVGVDYVIQVFSRFKIEFKKHENAHDALVETISTSGRGLIFNSISSSAGFAMMLISTIEGLRQFGILAISTMIIALILAILILTPILSYIPDNVYKKIFKIKG